MYNPADIHPYRREGAYIPRVAAVHDLCGYGKCSLGVAIPVLSARRVRRMLRSHLSLLGTYPLSQVLHA